MNYYRAYLGKNSNSLIMKKSMINYRLWERGNYSRFSGKVFKNIYIKGLTILEIKLPET